MAFIHNINNYYNNCEVPECLNMRGSLFKNIKGNHVINNVIINDNVIMLGFSPFCLKTGE